MNQKGYRGMNYEGYYTDEVQRALFAVYHIDESYDMGELEALTPKMCQDLDAAISVLQKEAKDETIGSSLRHAEFLKRKLHLAKNDKR